MNNSGESVGRLARFYRVGGWVGWQGWAAAQWRSSAFAGGSCGCGVGLLLAGGRAARLPLAGVNLPVACALSRGASGILPCALPPVATALLPPPFSTQIPPARCLVICDDLDIPTAAVRLRAKGGHGGQNGMKSIGGEGGAGWGAQAPRPWLSATVCLLAVQRQKALVGAAHPVPPPSPAPLLQPTCKARTSPASASASAAPQAACPSCRGCCRCGGVAHARGATGRRQGGRLAAATPPPLLRQPDGIADHRACNPLPACFPPFACRTSTRRSRRTSGWLCRWAGGGGGGESMAG